MSLDCYKHNHVLLKHKQLVQIARQLLLKYGALDMPLAGFSQNSLSQKLENITSYNYYSLSNQYYVSVSVLYCYNSLLKIIAFSYTDTSRLLL